MRRTWRFNPLWPVFGERVPSAVGRARCVLCNKLAKLGDSMMLVQASETGSRYAQATLVIVHAPGDRCRARRNRE